MNLRYIALAAVVVLAGLFVWHWSSSAPASFGSERRIVDVEFDPARGADFRIEKADVRCGADEVTSVQSRTYSNQGDIEFWCRENNQPAPQFKDIGQGDDRVCDGSIANISGRLYEVVSQSYHSESGWQSNLWRRFTRRIDRTFGDQAAKLIASGRVVNVQKRHGKTYRFVVSDQVCTGLSLFSDDGYYGTYQAAD